MESSVFHCSVLTGLHAIAEWECNLVQKNLQLRLFVASNLEYSESFSELLHAHCFHCWSKSISGYYLASSAINFQPRTDAAICRLEFTSLKEPYYYFLEARVPLDYCRWQRWSCFSQLDWLGEDKSWIQLVLCHCSRRLRPSVDQQLGPLGLASPSH